MAYDIQAKTETIIRRAKEKFVFFGFPNVRVCMTDGCW